MISQNVVSYSYEDDYAILSPTEDYVSKFDKIHSLSIGSLDDVHIGDSCFTIGNINGYGLSMNEGIISSGLKIVEYKGKRNTFIQTSIEISKGSSGGLLFDQFFSVIGMCAFRLRDDNLDYVDGMSFFIPLDRIV